jgi:tetratricopeptide (TPR) repeat protein
MTDSLAERLQTMFSTAISFHQQGEGEKARQIYEQIIQLNPAHFEALHLLGLVAAQKGNYRLAVEWIDKAIAIDSGNQPVQEASCGWSVAAGDIPAISQAILDAYETPTNQLELMGNNGYHYVIKNHSYDVLCENIIKWLDE